MKKIVFVLVALVAAAPAFGVAVDVNAIQVGSTTDVNITYIASGGKLPRAFALNIKVDSGEKITGISHFFAGECTSSSKGYGIFPGSFDRYINPSDPNWQDVNYTPVAPNDFPGALGGLDTNGITIEMGSLYAGPNEGPNSPATSGTLCRITVSGGCTVTLTSNAARGKVVFEDSTEANPINLGSCTLILDVNVPDVLAMNLTDATAAIEANGLNVGAVVYECNDVEVADQVLDQFPVGGTTVLSGSDVNLWVSLGSAVPDVVGDSNAVAQADIVAAGFVVGNITTDCNGSIAAGNVISTDPAAGEQPGCGTDVNMVISLGACDFGDANDPPYPTLLSTNGARHRDVGVRLGALRDTELDGAPTPGCDGDDIAVTDDEDGVTNLVATLTAGTVDVNVSASCYLNAWIDFTDDGDWDDSGEQIFTNYNIAGAGTYNLPFTVVGAVKNTDLISRWRVTDGSMAVPAYTGLQLTGEVEDYNDLKICHVPDVVGDPCGVAIAELIAEGFVIGTITTECNDTIADGNVISTDPAFCNYPGCGTDVNLVISTGTCVTCDCPGDVSGSIAGTLPVDGYIKAADAITLSQWLAAYAIKGKITCDWTPPGWIPTGCDDCPGDVSGSIAGTLPVDGYIKAADAITVSQWLAAYAIKGKITCPWTPPGW